MSTQDVTSREVLSPKAETMCDCKWCRPEWPEVFLVIWVEA